MGTTTRGNQASAPSAGSLTGTVAVANGGTNSNTALSNNRVMVSSAGAIVENGALAANVAIVTDSNGLPANSTTTAAELAFVHNVTSAIQTQINARSLLITTQSTTTVPNANTNSGTLAQLGTVNVAVTTVRNNEVIILGFTGAFQQNGATAVQAHLGYQLDSDTAVTVGENGCSVSGQVFDCNFIIPVVVATAGAHTFKLMWATDSGTVRSYTSATLPGTFFAIQF